MGGHVESLKYDGEVRESKLLWVLGNYSRFIRPGMMRIKCELSEDQSMGNGVLVSAYLDEQEDRIVYVFTNLSTDEKLIDIGVDQNIDLFVTSKDHSLEHETQNARKLRLKARSVSTAILE